LRLLIRESGQKKLSIALPPFFLAPLLAFGLSRYSKHVIPLSRKGRRQIIASALRCRRRHPHLAVVEVDSADGDQISIRW